MATTTNKQFQNWCPVMMGGSSELLRCDLRALHTALGEVLSCSQPDVPSWRFPEKLSASVTLDDVLASRESKGEGDCGRVALLEGIVDRLVLLLQCSLKLWSDAEDRPSHPLPLSLSSVVKKYCRKLLHKAKKTQETQQQLTAKDVQISALTLSLSRAEEECQLLQDALRDSRDTAAHNRPGSVLPKCVPYEARSSLSISRLHSSQSIRQPLYKDTHDHSQALTASRSSPLISLSTDDTAYSTLSTAAHSLSAHPKTRTTHTTVSTQTAETAFALCVRCSSTHNVLATAAGRLEELCLSLHLPSLLAETDWRHQAELGVLEPGRWGEIMASDLDAIRTQSHAQEKEWEQLKEELAQQKSLEPQLHSKVSQLSLQCELLQQTISESKKSHARELVSCHEAAAAQLREVEAARKMTQEHCHKLEEQLTCAQREKDELRVSLAKIERQQSSLQAELLEVRDREMVLHSSQAALQGKLDRLQGELSQCRNELETGRLQLSKTTALNHTLQRKTKAIQCRERDVLQRLEELDKETEDLRRELTESTSARNQLVNRVEELQAECSSLHNQVAEYELKTADSVKQQQCLHEELASMELQLASLSSKLEEEKEKCRLLVDYPDQQSSRPTEQLSGRESQEYISANTIRILLLEEKNTELREKMLQHARRINGKRKTELKQPVALWHSALVSQAQSALLCRDKDTTASPPPAHHTTPYLPPASREARPHCDPATYSDRAACTTTAGPTLRTSSVLHMHTCATCDRMFPDRNGLHHHQATNHLTRN